MSATLSQLIPFSELSPGQAGTIRNELIRKIVSEAVARLRLPEERLIVRDIRAKDDIVIYSKGADANVEDWGAVTGTTADAYETMATGTVDDQTWIGLYGVKADAEANACSAIKFNVGGADRMIWQLQALSEEDGFVGFCPSGLIIPQNTIYTISRFVRDISSPAKLVLKGIVVEPRGKVVSP